MDALATLRRMLGMSAEPDTTTDWPDAVERPAEPPPAIPPGYREDSQGRLVPESTIRPHERERDDLVRALVARCVVARDDLADLKMDMLRDVAGHVARVAARYGVAIEGRSGGVVLESYDGRMRVERVTSERTTVGEGIHAAEQLVRDYLHDETTGASDGLVAIVDRSFRRNRKTGELNAARLLDLVGVDIDDDRWRRAQQAVREAIQPAGSVTYFRAYWRPRADQPWQQVALDFSALPVPEPAPAAVAEPEQEAAA